MDGDLEEYTVFLYAKCIAPSGGPGAYGLVIISGKDGSVTERSQGYNCTTINRMELAGIIAAMEFVPKGKVIIYSEAKYIAEVLSGKRKKKKNTDLWERLERTCKNKGFILRSLGECADKYYYKRCCEICEGSMYKVDDMREDHEYISMKRQYQKDKTSMMMSGGVAFTTEIILPEKYKSESVHLMTADEYAQIYKTTVKGAESIQKFKLFGIRDFQAYKKIVAGGQDSWSRKKENELLDGIPDREQVKELINKYILDEEDLAVCLRWYRRGLPLYDSIKKTLVDAEVRKLYINQKND